MPGKPSRQLENIQSGFSEFGTSRFMEAKKITQQLLINHKENIVEGIRKMKNHSFINQPRRLKMGPTGTWRSMGAGHRQQELDWVPGGQLKRS